MNTTPSNRNSFDLKMLLVLSYGHLVTDIYQGALPAILPFLKAKLLLSYTTTGMIMLASNVTSSVIQPFFGSLSDKKEKSFLLPLGCFAAGLGIALLSLPNDFATVLLLVMLSGFGVASYHPEGYKSARFFTGDKPATGLSVFTVGGNVGFALGPIITLYVITHLGLDYLPMMVMFAVVFLVLLACTWGTITHAQDAVVQSKVKSGETSRGTYTAVGLLVGVVVMRSWVQFGLVSYIPFYYIDYLKGDPIYAGTLVSSFLVGGAVGTLLGSPLADKWGYKRYLVISMALSSILMPLSFLTDGFLLILTYGAIGMTLISNSTPTVVMAQELLPQNLGVASGLMVGFAIGMGGVGVTVLGFIADHFGVPVALQSIMVLPEVGTAIACFIPNKERRRELCEVH